MSNEKTNESGEMATIANAAARRSMCDSFLIRMQQRIPTIDVPNIKSVHGNTAHLNLLIFAGTDMRLN